MLRFRSLTFTAGAAVLLCSATAATGLSLSTGRAGSAGRPGPRRVAAPVEIQDSVVPQPPVPLLSKRNHADGPVDSAEDSDVEELGELPVAGDHEQETDFPPFSPQDLESGPGAVLFIRTVLPLVEAAGELESEEEQARQFETRAAQGEVEVAEPDEDQTAQDIATSISPLSRKERRSGTSRAVSRGSGGSRCRAFSPFRSASKVILLLLVLFVGIVASNNHTYTQYETHGFKTLIDDAFSAQETARIQSELDRQLGVVVQLSQPQWCGRSLEPVGDSVSAGSADHDPLPRIPMLALRFLQQEVPIFVSHHSVNRSVTRVAANVAGKAYRGFGDGRWETAPLGGSMELVRKATADSVNNEPDDRANDETRPQGEDSAALGEQKRLLGQVYAGRCSPHGNRHHRGHLNQER